MTFLTGCAAIMGGMGLTARSCCVSAHAATYERSGGLLLVIGLGLFGLCLGAAFR